MSESQDITETHEVSESHDKPGDEAGDTSEPQHVPETEEKRKAVVAKKLGTLPDGPVGTDKGLLSLIGDPLGRVLNVALRPLGYVTGAIARPPGEALLAVEKRVKDDYGYVKKDDKKNEKLAGVGGNMPNGQNPLGL
ncbi:hypothetical protein LTR85_002636 [Meristemomyces frigidus]|nr:hypothetical protein LTR85_002636 [Meristemomyces frigidus]